MRKLLVPTLVLLSSTLFGFSCQKEPEYKTKTYTTRAMKSVTSEVPLPDGLWSQIETLAAASKPGGAAAPAGGEHGEAKPSDGHGEEKKAGEHGEGHGDSHAVKPKKASGTGEVPSKFMRLKVYLVEDTPGILGGRNYKLEYAEGGGELDLGDFVVADKIGSFKVAIETLVPVPAPKEEPKKEEKKEEEHAEPAPEGGEHGEGGGDHGGAKKEAKAAPAEPEPPGPLKVYYLSSASRRKIDDEVVGAGCRNYYEISSYFDKAMKKEGIATTTLGARHVSALAGTYFFAQTWNSHIYLTHLTIKDSRYKDLQCRAQRKGEAQKPAAKAAEHPNSEHH